MSLPQEEVIFWCEVPWGDFQHGGSKHYTKQLKGEAAGHSSEESDVELSLGLKEILIEPEGIYQCTQIRIGTIAPMDYNVLARGIEESDEYSAIAEFQSSNSYMEKKAFAYMVETEEEVAKRFKEQARM